MRCRVLIQLMLHRDVHPVGSSLEIDEEMAAPLIAARVLEPIAPPPAPMEPPESFTALRSGTLPERLDTAIALLVARAERPDADWTRAGKPQVDALERLIDMDVSAAERDDAWARHEEAQAPS